MDGWIARDVVRLILRYIPDPFAGRGLLGTNRFWRDAAAQYYQAASRKALCTPSRVPLYYTLAVIEQQVAQAPAHVVVWLDVLWRISSIASYEAIRLQGLYQAVAGPLQKAETKLKQRQAEVAAREWGVGRRGNREGLSDEDWTRGMLNKALKFYDKLHNDNGRIKEIQQQHQAAQKRSDRLLRHIMAYYEPNGAIGCWRPADANLCFLADYPQERLRVKRKVSDTNSAYEAALAEERALTAKYSKVKWAKTK